MIKVSVILPVLNSIQYIEACIQSIRQQKLKEIEVICVDAGSTDGTKELIESYIKRDDRIRLIESSKKSYGYQVNLGIKASKGEYIGIVEADDYIEPDMYYELYNMVSANKVDFVKGDYNQIWDIEDRRITQPAISRNTDEISECILDLQENRDWGLVDINHIWTGLYRREFILEYALFLNETPGASYQDTSFSILVGLVAKTCVYTKKRFYNYRRDNPNSSVKSMSKYRCIIDEFDYITWYAEQNSLYTNENGMRILKLQIGTYKWNMQRLNEQGQQLFLDEIKDKIKEIMDNREIKEVLDERELLDLYFLSDYQKIQQSNQLEKETCEKCKQLIKDISNGKQYVVVGAGAYFEHLILLQNFLGKNFISKVCDNKLNGHIVQNYFIHSVLDLVNSHKGDNWIIANKYYANDILEQITKLGVQRENIIVMDQMPSQDFLVKSVLELRG